MLGWGRLQGCGGLHSSKRFGKAVLAAQSRSKILMGLKVVRFYCNGLAKRFLRFQVTLQFQIHHPQVDADIYGLWIALHCKAESIHRLIKSFCLHQRVA